MPGEKEEGLFHFLEHLYCCICQREVLVKPGAAAFCEEHQPLYEARQREGVTTEELSRQWADSLDNWRERPTELDVEQRTGDFATSWQFHKRDGAWVLFMRSYAPKYLQEPRLSDGLAVNIQTGEIRRFVEAEEEGQIQAQLTDREQDELADRLRAKLKEQLSHPGPTNLQTAFHLPYLDEQHRLSSFPALVQALPFPAYGLVGHPLDLSVCSVSWGQSGHYLTSFGVTYSSFRYPQVRENVEIFSRDTKDRSVVYRPPEQGSPPFWQGELRIDGKVFTGEIFRWSLPQEIARQLPQSSMQEGTAMFYLRGKETVLSGKVRGPSVEEVPGLLQGLVILNDRADLIEQYQQELEQEMKRLFGEWERFS
jgi:hypothetical protein